MPKMIKVTLKRPSNSIGWGIVADENPGDAVVTSHAAVQAKTLYTSTDPAAYIKQTVFDSPDDLHMQIYFKFNDYPDSTPSNLKSWFWDKKRAIDTAELSDTTKSITDPITGDARTLNYNVYQKWINEYFNANGITFTAWEEVEHSFPE